jgi:hypothetical protein
MRILKDFIIIMLFSYGSLHMSYKYMVPDLANQDFARYNMMIKAPLDMDATEAPFVLRQIPTGIAYLIKEAGIIYRSRVIGFQYSRFYESDDDLRNFFALILSNYLALAVSILLIVTYIRKHDGQNKLFTVLALSMGYFMVPISVVAPLTHGYAWLACVLMAIGLIEKKAWYLLSAIILSFFSRETVILFFSLFVALLFIINRNNHFYRNASVLLLLSTACFFVTRKFFVHGYEYQLSFPHSASDIMGYALSADFLFQTFVTQGAVAFLCYHLYRRSRNLSLIYISSLFAIILFCIVIMVAGAGRIIGESYPLLIVLFCLPDRKLELLMNRQQTV